MDGEKGGCIVETDDKGNCSGCGRPYDDGPKGETEYRTSK